MAVVGIVPAAGSGERLGGSGPKAFALCGGRPLAAWSLDVLLRACDRVVVAAPPGHSDLAEATLTPPGTDRERLAFVPGRATRAESVRAAVAEAPGAGVYVVHDAARPLLTEGLVAACVSVLDQGWDGAVAAARVSDTIKEVEPDRRIARTLDRSRLWAMQTPQVFQGEVLRRALAQAGETLSRATDDAAIVEAAGGRVCVVPSPPENIKVTTLTDLRLAELLLARRVA